MESTAKGEARLGDLTLREFIGRLASAEPVPGGGSAAAIAAGLGAGLVTMVARLSEDRPSYAVHQGTIARARDLGIDLATRFIALADRDIAAYARLAAARKLPKATVNETAARQAAVRRAAREASEAPLSSLEACRDLAIVAESLAGRSNSNASSDLVVAARLAAAAAEGAAENVRVNLPAVSDEAFAAAATARMEALLLEIERLAAGAVQAVRAGRVREPERSLAHSGD